MKLNIIILVVVTLLNSVVVRAISFTQFGTGRTHVSIFSPGGFVEEIDFAALDPVILFERNASGSLSGHGFGSFGSSALAVATADLRLRFEVPKQGGFLLSGFGQATGYSESHGGVHFGQPTAGPPGSTNSISVGQQSFVMQGELWYYDLRVVLDDPDASVNFNGEFLRNLGTTFQEGIFDTRRFGSVMGAGVAGAVNTRTNASSTREITDMVVSGIGSWNYSLFLFPILTPDQKPLGDTPGTALMPSIFNPMGHAQGTVGFEFTPKQDRFFYLDPAAVFGYEYTTTGAQMFESVVLPNLGDNSYLIELWDESTGSFIPMPGILAGDVKTMFPFLTQKFRVLGIEGTEEFITGIEFLKEEATTVFQTPLSIPNSAPIPEPSTLGIASAVVLISLAASRRRKRR